ncbi:iron-sulfur cluster repair di-iron protein [Trichothermofontia sichuanensis B231]|uniref:iron-sulfur cluster repair di-iron protein n=1 Tax=Trichothermofontia sichuanensis TaxID=3045816 RepID=UPI0022451786|nr:iron-sulfur cluster repair di-iron protein [Trichothermofontia sichuanensis]UZQ54225.1 iron-sulfur cluster repair di-iron protein [Trichothermofontia sichuanensis B231]
MATVQINDTVGAIVRDHPSLAHLFEQAQVDYCCGGQKTLAEVCAQRGIDPQSFLAELEAYSAATPAPESNLGDLSLTELANHIEQIHHAYLHRELPRLEKLVTKVATVHGEKEPRLRQIQEIFLALSAELTTHLMKEEQILFPMIRRLDASDSVPIFHGGTLANPIQQMELEHEAAGVALAQLRQLSDHFTPPDWACNTYRAMLDALHTFEQDMHQHVHKENNLLFPQAIALEQTKGQG